MPEELYEAPGTKISQGDILELLPHVFLDKPLLALKQEADTIFRAESEPFSAFDNKNGQSIIAGCKRQCAILINHDCEIEKPQTRRWLACPVMPISRLAPENQDRVRRNRIYAMLYFPRYREVLQESFVDFSQITTLHGDYVRTGKRLTSLSDTGRRAFYVQFIRWLTRWELRDLSCPSCAVTFNPAISLPVRTP